MEKKEQENKENKNDKDEEIKRLKAELEQIKRYAPEKVEIPEEQKNLPKGMQDGKIKTTVGAMTDYIKKKLMQIEDLATMEVLLDPAVRLKNRLQSIRDMSSAKHIKVRGMWKTIPPKLHIRGLTGKKLNNSEYEITFGVYETDEKGNKRLYTHYAEFTLHDGSTINRPTSAEYRVAYEVIETIRQGKPITREVLHIKN
jgi:hypothetical protein